jgi:NAD(P)-dependent dehydrogenase (short-subunit alcohol dehydrogenase family)
VCGERDSAALRAAAPLFAHPHKKTTTNNTHAPYSRRSSARGAASRAVAAAAAAKRVVITGGNTGIGLEAGLELAKKGFEVTLACRDDAKAAAAAERIRAAAPGAAVDTLRLDLADLGSVRDAAKRLQDDARPIDVLLNNAGVMACPYMETKQGFEYQFGVNHLGHYLLTTSLLPKLKAAAPGARVVNVASAAHAFGKIDFDSFRSDKGYEPWPRYGQSKLANIMFTYELARRLSGDPSAPTVNALHPGVVRTELGRYLVSDSSPWYTKAMWALMTPFTKSPPEGAKTSIYLASDAGVAGVSGKYYDNCRCVCGVYGCGCVSVLGGEERGAARGGLGAVPSPKERAAWLLLCRDPTKKTSIALDHPTHQADLEHACELRHRRAAAPVRCERRAGGGGDGCCARLILFFQRASLGRLCANAFFACKHAYHIYQRCSCVYIYIVKRVKNPH